MGKPVGKYCKLENLIEESYGNVFKELDRTASGACLMDGCIESSPDLATACYKFCLRTTSQPLDEFVDMRTKLNLIFKLLVPPQSKL